MHKLSNGNVPKTLQNLYKYNRDVHTHFTQQAHHFHSMRGNNEFIYRTFVFQSVVIWNKIIQNINIQVHIIVLSIYLKTCYYLMMLPLEMTNNFFSLYTYTLLTRLQITISRISYANNL